MKLTSRCIALLQWGKSNEVYFFKCKYLYIYIYNMYKEAAVACTKQLNCTKTMVVVVITTDKNLMFSLHSQLASDEYLIPGYGNENPRMLGSPYPRE